MITKGWFERRERRDRPPAATPAWDKAVVAHSDNHPAMGATIPEHQSTMAKHSKASTKGAHSH